MPRAIDQAIRNALWRAHQTEGLDSQSLALRFNLRRRTVENLLHQARLNHNSMPAAAYHCPGPACQRLANHPVFLQAQALRRDHPDWGAELVRVVLLEHFPKPQVPSSRTLQRWFVQLDLSAAVPGRRRLPVYHRATAVHQRWQCDATDQVALADGCLVSCLRCIDECSGAFLGSRVFPPGVQLCASDECAGGLAGDVQPLRVA